MLHVVKCHSQHAHEHVLTIMSISSTLSLAAQHKQGDVFWLVVLYKIGVSLALSHTRVSSGMRSASVLQFHACTCKFCVSLQLHARSTVSLEGLSKT